jgi:hypothetical protein
MTDLVKQLYHPGSSLILALKYPIAKIGPFRLIFYGMIDGMKF